MRLGGNGVLEFFDFADNHLAKSRLVDENGGMSNKMLKDLYGYGGTVFGIGAGLRALEQHTNVMLGTHVFGKAIPRRNERWKIWLGLGSVCIGIRVGGRRDTDVRNTDGRNAR